MYCVRWASVLGQLYIFLKKIFDYSDIQYYFMFISVWFLVFRILLLFGVQAERVKSLKRIVVELARHLHNRRTLCSFLWCFSSPSKEGTNCAVGTRTSALTVGWWMGLQHAVLSQPLVEQSVFLDFTPVAYTYAGGAGVQFCGLIHRGHGFPQTDFSIHTSSLDYFVLFCRPLEDTSLQSLTWHLPLPLAKDGFYTPFFPGYFLAGYQGPSEALCGCSASPPSIMSHTTLFFASSF